MIKFYINDTFVFKVYINVLYAELEMEIMAFANSYARVGGLNRDR